MQERCDPDDDDDDDRHCPDNCWSQIYIGLPWGTARPKIQLYVLSHLVHYIAWLI